MTDKCGAWGGCTLPAGHNKGRPDVPQNHRSDLPARDTTRIGDEAEYLRRELEQHTSSGLLRPGEGPEQAGGHVFETPDAAREAGRAGWNIRCNRCGSYGARWRPDERPGWHFGNLALCDLHADELEAEYRRHGAALAVLREVRYEQEAR